jgi:hypothetical protein
MNSTVIILLSLAIGFVVLFAFLLYAFNDLDAWSKKRTIALMLHVNICVASLEKRMALGQLRSPEELDASIEKYTNQLSQYGL